ncbi:MAG: hypothetical protein JW749_01855 [Sedimentisphaerales bacterium]|nr:hypothetical protein [Sedimentisphaerales bacterium]
MKRLFFVIVAVAIVSMSAQAKYSGGSGTADDPYKIATASDLLELAAATDDYDANFVLIADIDLTGYVFATAVIARDTHGSEDFDGYAFTGLFDGNDHKIRNLTINTGDAENDFLGLFGCLGDGGKIQNLMLDDVKIACTSYSQVIGALAGGNNRGTICNCRSTSIIKGELNSSLIGGLVGLNDTGNIINCCSSGDVSGGISIGGLVGGNDGNISKCFSTCDLEGPDYYSNTFGGLVGANKGEISNSYAAGTIIIGKPSGYLGGLVGVNQGGINNCYSSSLLTWGGIDKSYLGGLVGSNYDGDIISCYFVVSINNGLGELLTVAQMKEQASFVGWDFAGEKTNGKEDIWDIVEGVGYPTLIWVDVTKCAVKAGSRENSDKISISGKLDTGANYYFINSSVIKITIKSDHILTDFEHSFDINSKTFKKGRYRYSATDNGMKRSFQYNTKTRKFTLSVSNTDLSGLDCPITLHARVGDYHSASEFGEEIANGKKPMPMSLMMGVEDSLRVDKIQVKQGKTLNSDQLTVKGAFAMKNTNVDIAGSDLNITLNGVPYTIKAGKLIATKNGFGCKNVVLGDGFSIGSADFNFKKCTFKITLKKTEIDDGLSGLIDFGMMFGDYEENVEVELP